MDSAGKINGISRANVPDLGVRLLTIGLPLAFYCRYYYDYSPQTMVGEEISS